MIVYSGHVVGADSKEFIYERDNVRSLMNRGKIGEAINRWELKREMYGGTDGRYEHELGNLYFNVGRYTDAKIEFEGGIRVNQQYGPLYMGLALVNAKLGRDQEAYSAASQAIEKFPNWFGGYFAMANLEWQNMQKYP
jgi:tetratricopeptide (TPR) repeat protein